MWLRTGTAGGLLWVRWWTAGFHKMQRICWLGEELLASRWLTVSEFINYSRKSKLQVSRAWKQLFTFNQTHNTAYSFWWICATESFVVRCLRHSSWREVTYKGRVGWQGLRLNSCFQSHQEWTQTADSNAAQVGFSFLVPLEVSITNLQAIRNWLPVKFLL
jgi:hypothetical protein